MVEVEENVKLVRAKPFVVVGIPAFNEERSIARVVLEAQQYADAVIVCDDGSDDLTAEIAEKLGAEVIRHEKRLGYGTAIQSMFKRARELDADVFVTLDGDGQHDPCEIPNMVKPIVEGAADVVIGSRLVDKRQAYSMPWYRRAGVKFITWLVNNSGKYSLKDAQSGFRAYNRESLEKLSLTENGMGASIEILVNADKEGLRIMEVPASCNYGKNVEKSTHNPVKHGVSVVMSLVRLVVEERPLMFLGVPGIISLFLGVFFGAWMLKIYALERHIATNIALASIAFILIGLFAIFTAVTLYAISRLTQKINKK
ncbi:MAG: glycosyltransferase family 2 protein [Candidatus Bathyarchaeia archaeon]